MSEFKFSCPNCQQNIQATSEYSGVQINCPSCQTPLVVPAAPDAPAPSSPYTPPAGGTRLSKVAATTHAEPSGSATVAASIAAAKPTRKKKSKVGLIAGLSVGAVALAATIYFWPELMKKVTKEDQAAAVADQTPTNTPPPPPPELTTEEILTKVSDAYTGMTDYAAKAQTVGDLDMSALVPGQKALHITSTSSLQMGRSNYYRLEWEQTAAGTTVKGAAWNSGRGDFVGYGPAKPGKVKNRQLAMAPASQGFVLSVGLADLFFSATNSYADAAKDFTRTNNPNLNAQNNYVLVGDVEHQTLLLWINKDSFLITQMQFTLGSPIDEAELKKLPSAQRAQLAALSKIKGTITETYTSIQTNKNLMASAFEASYQPTADAGGARQRRGGAGAGQMAQPGGGAAPRRQRPPQ